MDAPTKSLPRFLRDFPLVATALFGSVTALPAFLFRGPIIPANSWELVPLSICLSAVCLYASWKHSERLKKHSFRLVWMTLAGILGLFLLNISLVKPVPIGSPGVSDHQKNIYYLVGFHVGESGVRRIEDCGLSPQESNPSDIIARCGYDKIGEIWGVSYGIARLALGFCYLMMIGGLVTLLGQGTATAPSMQEKPAKRKVTTTPHP